MAKHGWHPQQRLDRWRTRLGPPRVFLKSLVVLAVAFAPVPGEAATRTFTGGIEKVWTAARAALTSDGWDIEGENLARGSIVTGPRNVSFHEFGVYAEGTRHRLKLTFHQGEGGHVSVTVERELYQEQRVLWNSERKPLAPMTNNNEVELRVLQGIALFVPVAPPVVASPPPRAAPPAPPARPERSSPSPGQPVARAPRITYRVTGSGGSVQVTYRNAQGASDRETASTLPWELSFDGKNASPLYVSAVGQGASNLSLTCEILVDGTPRSQSMSVGASAVATCSLAMP
jgi:Mycobacterium membrane protein